MAHRGGRGSGSPGPTPGLERRVNAFPQAKHGDLRGCHQRKTYPNHWHIPPALHLALTTVIGGYPDTLPGPMSHSVRGPQRQHQPSPEPAQPPGSWPSDGLWVDEPPPPLSSVLVVLAHQYVVLVKTGHNDVIKK